MFIGDVFGRPGRQAVKRLLPDFRRREEIDFTIVNGENAAGGKGVTGSVVEELLGAGCDVITGGNHSFANREAFPIYDSNLRLIRPANFPDDPAIPGSGWGVYESPAGFPVGVLNLCGRVNIGHFDCPFRLSSQIVSQIRRETPLIFLDFHAEATSEKIAMGWHLDGKVTGVFGTHTHIATADERVLPGGTAYITDAGMTGPYDSVIGTKKELAIAAMTTQLKYRFEPASGDVRLCGVLVDADPLTGKATAIRRVMLPLAGEVEGNG
jgi:metallophosphoesterase (TIGR00282 family)